jgi:hypothetical protein
MPEPIETWWSRRQRSKGCDVPYAVGTYRDDWKPFRELARQYHPDLNHGIVLSQVPPAAEVYLLWVCDSGHRFVATPDERRSAAGASRRKSAWCPECYAAALGRSRTPAPAATSTYACGHACDERLLWEDRTAPCPLCRRLATLGRSREQLLELVAPSQREALAVEPTTVARYRWVCTAGHPAFEARIERVLERASCSVCRHAAAGADRVAVGDAFVSRWAPRPASGAEPELRRRIRERLAVRAENNAIRVARPFYGHIEVWPDIVLDEFRVAIEYDTTGRTGAEHVGRREESDRRKDRLLRQAGWEVIRVRCGALVPIGPYDIKASGVTGSLVEEILDRIGAVRGDLIVASYLRSAAGSDA